MPEPFCAYCVRGSSCMKRFPILWIQLIAAAIVSLGGRKPSCHLKGKGKKVLQDWNCNCGFVLSILCQGSSALRTGACQWVEGCCPCDECKASSVTSVNRYSSPWVIGGESCSWLFSGIGVCWESFFMRCIFLHSVDLFATLLALSLLYLICWGKRQLSVCKAHPLSSTCKSVKLLRMWKICWALLPVYSPYFYEDENQGIDFSIMYRFYPLSFSLIFLAFSTYKMVLRMGRYVKQHFSNWLLVLPLGTTIEFCFKGERAELVSIPSIKKSEALKYFDSPSEYCGFVSVWGFLQKSAHKLIMLVIGVTLQTNWRAWLSIRYTNFPVSVSLDK